MKRRQLKKLCVSRYYSKVVKDLSNFKEKTMRRPTDREIEILKPPLIDDEDRFHSPMTLLRMFLYEEK